MKCSLDVTKFDVYRSVRHGTVLGSALWCAGAPRPKSMRRWPGSLLSSPHRAAAGRKWPRKSPPPKRHLNHLNLLALIKFKSKFEWILIAFDLIHLIHYLFDKFKFIESFSKLSRSNSRRKMIFSMCCRIWERFTWSFSGSGRAFKRFASWPQWCERRSMPKNNLFNQF